MDNYYAGLLMRFYNNFNHVKMIMEALKTRHIEYEMSDSEVKDLISLLGYLIIENNLEDRL